MKDNSKIQIYFPGWTKKSLTFTIDDGNIKMDTKFLDIIRSAGILGTFNLCDTSRATRDEYLELYKGYEIANHCKHHPFVFEDGMKYQITDEPFDSNNSRDYTEDDPVVYKAETESLYKIHNIPTRIKPNGWFSITDKENYLRFSREAKCELEDVFGKGSVKGFVWPYREQNNSSLFEALTKEGYNSIRKTGEVGVSRNFDLPDDRMRWSYTATNRSMLNHMAEYEKYSDDGKLKFFAFGVHSYDFERDNNWCDLAEFANKYGNRPDDYYYATVSDIFEYEDAVNALIVNDSEIINNSDRKIYLSLSGKRVIIEPNSKLKC